MRRHVRSICAVGALVAIATAVNSAAASNQLFWSGYNTNNIGFANTDGAGARDLISSAGGPWGTAIDAAAGKVYWAAFDANTIRVADLDGSNAGLLNTTGATVASPFGLSFDPATGTLYWANDTGDDIYYAKADGSGGGLLYDSSVVSELKDPVSTAIDPSAGKIYWSNFGSGTIGHAKLDGSGSPGEITFSGACTSLELSYAVMVDSAKGTLYQFGYDTGTSKGVVQSAALDGSNCTNLVTDLTDYTTGGALDPSSNRLIYPDYNTAVMRYIDLDDASTGLIDVSPVSLAKPNYPAILATPGAVAPPAITPTSAAAGATLTCSAPVWGSGIPGMNLYRSPAASSGNKYSWSRNGAAVVGTTPSITASEEGTYKCTVAATNGAGEGTATSNEVTVAAAPTTNPDPVNPDLVTPVAPVTSRAIHGGKTRTTIRLRYDQTGRFSFYLQNAAGKRVALLRGSRVGKRVLKQTFTAPVVQNGVAGTNVTLSFITKGKVASGTNLRSILSVSGDLRGQDLPVK